ncbi:MAG: VWA domain-containing protein [Bryobacteraceae bacterium]
MNRLSLILTVFMGLLLPVQRMTAQTWYLTGQVLMEDGSPPPKPAMIERDCGGISVIREASTNRDGRYHFRLMEVGGLGASPLSALPASLLLADTRCVLRATLSGYESSIIDLSGWRPTNDPHLPTLVLRRPRPEATFPTEAGSDVPRPARKAWVKAMKAVEAGNWPSAEQILQPVVAAHPKFARGWHLLGAMHQNQQKAGDAMDAFRKAIEADPKELGPQVMLTRLAVQIKDWETALIASEALVRADSRHRYPEAYLHNAVARYHRSDLDGAEKSAREALRLDRKRLLPRAEFVLGTVLAAKRDYQGAASHLGQYLQLEPKAADAEAVRTRIANLGKPETAAVAAQLEIENLNLPPAGEAWVPGGMRALAKAARISTPVTFEDFFDAYCRARVRYASPDSSQSLTGYLRGLRAYFAAMNELSSAGERREGRTVITLALSVGPRREETLRVLRALGWSVVTEGSAISVEPGTTEADGARQPILGMLGVDEIDMKEALEAGRSCSFEIPTENARLIGGEAWDSFLGTRKEAFPGALAEAFVRDLRLAKVYTGLSTMGSDTAATLVAGVGLRKLVRQYSDLLGEHGAAFALRGEAAAVPGGESAEGVWAKLADANPRDAKAFFRALFAKDNGRLAAYYAAISQTDEAHRRFFTSGDARAAHFYRLFRNPYETSRPGEKPGGSWLPQFYGQLPLDGGTVRFPGGRGAWSTVPATDEDILAKLASPELFIELGRIERERGVPLDEASVRAILRNHADWRPIFEYFHRLPGLGAPEFSALERFTASARGFEPARREIAVGQWYSLVELLALGVGSGALDTESSARSFRRVCDSVGATGSSAQAIEALRAMLGRNADPDDAVPGSLLRLSGAGRERFDMARRSLNVPRLARLNAKDDAAVLNALSGLVYAAWLDPEALLVSEDPGLLSKHRFTAPASGPQAGALFAGSELVRSHEPPGSRFQGGFGGFGELARTLARGEAVAVAPGQEAARAQPRTVSAAAQSRGRADRGMFRADSRLVEVPVTITDGRGRYVDNLQRPQFTVTEEGQSRPIAAFEMHSSNLSCALLLDTTGSMQAALPALKNAALKLIDGLRDNDMVAVYSFQETVSLLQPFTTDKRAAKRAVLRAYPDGRTALNDAMVTVARDIASRGGKKAIVVFTDGSDNMSTLTADTAARRANAVGAPVYAIAQGEALLHPALLKQLRSVSVATGGLSFTIRRPDEIRGVFESVAGDLKHGYLLAFRPPEVKPGEWRKIEVRLAEAKSYKVRSREGYYSE